MDSRKKIALTYNYSENWIAGSYYVANMLRSVNLLSDEEKPHFIIVIQSYEGLNLIQEIKYPYINFVNINEHTENFLLKYFRKITRKVIGKNYWVKSQFKNVKHIFEGNELFDFIPNHYYWVHDFQECRLPTFFSEEEAAKRSALPKKVAQLKNATLILSSYDALNDFKLFFPGYLCKVKVLRFASSLPDFSDVNFEEELSHYNIKTPYFICSNQFWQHKNHQLILDAIFLLKNKNLSFQVIFTGKNFDHRNPDYFLSLEKFIKENSLEKWVNFLGFIDRKVQLKLAEQALSYIQPSLFEGWSTTVEDAKCLNQYILLSNIPVHKEQLDYNVDFFDPYQPADLAAKMEEIFLHGAKKERRNYEDTIKKFGKEIIAVFSE